MVRKLDVIIKCPVTTRDGTGKPWTLWHRNTPEAKATRERAAGPRTCLAEWKRTGCGLTIDGSTDDAISITGVEKYQFEEVEPEDAAEQQLQGLDEAEANLGDSEEPDRDGEEEKEEEKGEEVLAGESEYWVQCGKCQKWRKLPTAWGPHEDFICDRILVRCAQQCDVCKTSRCSLSCSPE
jgi:hypothetical protein